MDHKTNIQDLKEITKTFCEERDWSQYHNAKELSIGIVTEASELLQEFRFKSEEDIKEIFSNENKRTKVCDEMADVLYFLLRMAQIYGIDLTSEFKRKMKKSAEKYPIDKVKGLNKRYDEL